MTTTDVAPEVTTTTEDSDPFRYGWRYVQRERPDGYYDVEQIPLTLEDLLHPEEGDHVTHSSAHQHRIRYMCNVFESLLTNDPTAVVLDDVRIKWDTPELKAHGPDIMVILGVKEHKNWSTFDVAAEGVRPVLIVEITSPETGSIDRSTKLEEYDLAEVPLYIIVDTVRRRGESFLRLLGYRRTAMTYEVLPPDERGWLWLEPLKVWLGIHDNELYCYDMQGVQIGDYTAVADELADERQARTAAEEQAAQERQARTAAEEQTAQERQARADAEAQATSERQARTAAEEQAAQERQARAEAEAQSAQERQARSQAETRLQELEAELRRMRGD